MIHKTEIEIGGDRIVIETGRVARQAGGAVFVQCGGTVVLSTATAAKQAREDVDFFPLTVDYRERAYAAGKIPGGFFKREGRPSDRETLAARLIDRPIRPLFPEGFKCPTHIVNFILSHDQQHESDILAILGASAALMISDIPFEGPVSPVRIGRIDGELRVNPTVDELAASDMNITVVCSRDSIVMVEGGANEIPEEVLIDALKLAFDSAQVLNQAQIQLAEQAGKEKRTIEKTEVQWLDAGGNPVDPDPIFESLKKELNDALRSADKLAVYNAIDELKRKYAEHFDVSDSARMAAFQERFSKSEKEVARRIILEENIRNDGRRFDEIRPISCEVDLLPRVHGSALFTRGQTQALVSLTLGSAEDEQKIDDLEGETSKTFMLHYNFPPFSVGETGFLRGPGRREVGHGNLAERAIQPMIPDEEDFPYTIRIVSDIMESNGSSSMATVCGASLSLMDGGVPIQKAVAGIAMGLVLEGDKYAVLSDISGLEDHLGDMDFKVAGTYDGINAIQMDIKLKGFKFEILEQALAQALKGRRHILDVMAETIASPRENLKPYAPRIHIMKINPAKIGTIVGPGGKMIRSITSETGVKISLEDDGTVKILSQDERSLKAAIKRIEDLTEEVTVGKDYKGKVRRIESYGAFIEILPGMEGLLHISQFANYRVENVRDEMEEGDEVLVRVLEVDPSGKIRLSRKILMDEGVVKGKKPKSEHSQGSGGRHNSRRDSHHGHQRDNRHRSGGGNWNRSNRGRSNSHRHHRDSDRY